VKSESSSIRSSSGGGGKEGGSDGAGEDKVSCARLMVPTSLSGILDRGEDPGEDEAWLDGRD